MLLRVSFLGCADANGQDPVGGLPGLYAVEPANQTARLVVSGITVSQLTKSVQMFRNVLRAVAALFIGESSRT